jgi:Flp pilus assembly protein TadB
VTLFVVATNPTYLNILIEHPTGHMFMFVAIGLWVSGVVWLMRLAKVEF